MREDASPGTESAERSGELTIARQAVRAYAQAAGDFNPIHLDDDAARRFGLPGIIAHGMLVMGILGRLLLEGLPDARLETFSARFRAVVQPDRPLRWLARAEERDGQGWERWQLELRAADSTTLLVAAKATVRRG